MKAPKLAFTKEERTELHRAVQDITLFLRLATLRIDNVPDALPFKPNEGRMVIGWLHNLAHRYSKGEDITT